MRCQICDCSLTDYETTLKHEKTKEYLDICLECLGELDDILGYSVVEGSIELDDTIEDVLGEEDIF